VTQIAGADGETQVEKKELKINGARPVGVDSG
jgi:hypothetical protein